MQPFVCTEALPVVDTVQPERDVSAVSGSGVLSFTDNDLWFSPSMYSMLCDTCLFVLVGNFSPFSDQFSSLNFFDNYQ